MATFCFIVGDEIEMTSVLEESFAAAAAIAVVSCTEDLGATVLDTAERSCDGTMAETPDFGIAGKPGLEKDGTATWGRDGEEGIGWP